VGAAESCVELEDHHTPPLENYNQIWRREWVSLNFDFLVSRSRKFKLTHSLEAKGAAYDRALVLRNGDERV